MGARFRFVIADERGGKGWVFRTTAKRLRCSDSAGKKHRLPTNRVRAWIAANPQCLAMERAGGRWEGVAIVPVDALLAGL